MINLDRFLEDGFVKEISIIVATVVVYLERSPKITINVHKYPNAGFMAISDHAFWGPDQAGPYRSIQMESSIEAAIEDSIRGLRSFYKDEFPNEKIFWVRDNDYVDGDGRTYSYDEAISRRNG